MRIATSVPGSLCTELDHWQYGKRWLLCAGQPGLLFTENETNYQQLFGGKNLSYVKDAFHGYVIRGDKAAVNPGQVGTKMAALYRLGLGAGESMTLKLRLADMEPLGAMDSNSPMVGAINAPGHAERAEGVPGTNDFGAGFDDLFARRQKEADAFYASRLPKELSEDAKLVMRQAFAGMMWNKQFYHYDVRTWLDGDPAGPPPPKERLQGRNHDWTHLYTDDVLSMPDKWEYPWFAAWDLAFHTIPIALIDPDFAKDQLILLLREWYMHPNGQLPAYEWAFGDVNPPVHAWAAFRVYKIERRLRGVGDRGFLEKVFHKLLLNFTWWVNRKDPEGMNIFEGGFLGLDNIGVFDRSAPLPTGGHLEQSDGTSWMGMFCLNMLAIALELAKEDPAYEDMALKFLDHFLLIAGAMTDMGKEGIGLWDDQDNFFYDVLSMASGDKIPLRLRSMVGLIPLFAVGCVEENAVDDMPELWRKFELYRERRPDLVNQVSRWNEPGAQGRRLIALVRAFRMTKLLRRMLDESEFLSPYGVRALSAVYRDHPYDFQYDGAHYRVRYEPGESETGMFGGNSN